MIKNIEIQDFKCFRNNTISLNKATLLLGTNSGGKSSFIQSILLSKIILDNRRVNLIDNSFNINFNSFEDIINVEADDSFIFEIKNDKHECLKVKCMSGEDTNILDTEVFGETGILSSEIIYLSADRNISKIQMGGDISNLNLGASNEHLAFILEKGKQKNKINFFKERNHWTTSDTQLLDIQINDWLNYILPNNYVTAINYKYDHLYSLGFGANGKPFKQSNVGFGVSFILPIIVAGLTAEPESIVIVENPELHLHPKAQSNIAAFLATVASNGVQVIIETHSDHIINGFRKAVLNTQINLNNTDLVINYFENSPNCKVEEVLLNEHAEVDNWPKGFMDQSEEDLFEIRKLRRRK